MDRSKTGLFAPAGDGVFDELLADVWLHGGNEAVRDMDTLVSHNFPRHEAAALATIVQCIEPLGGEEHETRSSFVRKLVAANAHGN